MALVTNSEQVSANIARFEAELSKTPALADIMAYSRAWYAHRDAHGAWRFAPSKFAGYADNTGKAYLKQHQDRDGRQTERVLSEWFTEVDPGSTLGVELHEALKKFIGRFGRVPNKLIRISVESEVLPANTAGQSGNPDLARITMDTRVCGGRPCIRNMRIRVSDILDMIAGGATRAEILEDFPYLEDADITAALAYAAQAVDHRIVRAA